LSRGLFKSFSHLYKKKQISKIYRRWSSRRFPYGYLV